MLENQDDPILIEQEILGELEKLDTLDDEDELEQAEQENEEIVSNIQAIKDIENLVNYMVRLRLEHDKLVPVEYLNRFKILLIGGKSWGQKSMRINQENDPFVYYTMTYKIGELDLILDRSYKGQINQILQLRKMISSTLVNVWRDRFPAFSASEIWARKAKKSKKLFKLRFKKDASELFDLVELGRCTATYETKIVVTDRYTGHKEIFNTSGSLDPHYLSTPQKLVLSEHLKAADSLRYGIENEEDSLLDKQIDEFVERENVEKNLTKNKND
jgi:hypothetical protein